MTKKLLNCQCYYYELLTNVITWKQGLKGWLRKSLRTMIGQNLD